MAIERVDRVAGPLVEGALYLVPTVRAKWYKTINDWPVIGPKHTDERFFNLKEEHYHIDVRFMRSEWRKRSGSNAFSSPLTNCREGEMPSPVFRRRKCRAALVAYPFAGFREIVHLQGYFAGQICPRGKGGWICPHQKASLGSVLPVDGVITCPLHGLRIDAQSGTVLP